MPYLKIQTNLPLGKKARQSVLRSASALIARELDKPEAYVMVALEPDTAMVFAGSDDPVAFLELAGIGLLPRHTKKLSAALCAFIGEHLGVPRERVYVKFAGITAKMWGWNGGVF